MNEDIIICQHPLDSTLLENLLDKSIYLERGGIYDEAEASYRQFLIAKTEGKGMESTTRSWRLPQQIFHPQILAIQNSAFPLMTLALDDSILPPENFDEQTLLSEFKRLGIRTTFIVDYLCICRMNHFFPLKVWWSHIYLLTLPLLHALWSCSQERSSVF